MNVEQLVARDRARQGLPPRITNTEALDRVAAVLAADHENTTARRLPSAERSRTEAAGVRSDPTSTAA